MRWAPAFAPTCRDSVALALPLCADVIVSQLASLVAVQLQPVNASRLTVKPPPANPIESLERFHAYRHGAADWPSSTVWPPTVIVAERADGAGFAATV
jgi:hypothetical protein